MRNLFSTISRKLGSNDSPTRNTLVISCRLSILPPEHVLIILELMDVLTLLSFSMTSRHYHALSMSVLPQIAIITPETAHIYRERVQTGYPDIRRIRQLCIYHPRNPQHEGHLVWNVSRLSFLGEFTNVDELRTFGASSFLAWDGLDILAKSSLGRSLCEMHITMYLSVASKIVDSQGVRCIYTA